jgi:glycolate oxidase FAD binding subunit
MDWGGAQRWLKTTLPAQQVWQRAAEHGGSAALFRNSLHETEKFQALSAPMATLHRRLKAAFDPLAILNPGRLYADL